MTWTYDDTGRVTSVAVPVTTGYILNFVGYQVPFLIACVFATMTIFVTRRLNPASQRSPARVAEDRRIEERLSAPRGKVLIEPADG
jgi:predicted MFS family arabinose efflux permease